MWLRHAFQQSENGDSPKAHSMILKDFWNVQHGKPKKQLRKFRYTWFHWSTLLVGVGGIA